MVFENDRDFVIKGVKNKLQRVVDISKIFNIFKNISVGNWKGEQFDST